MLLTALGQGREAEVHPWGDGFVLKLFWPEYGRVDVEREALLTQQIWLMGVPAPRVHDVMEVHGRWGMVMEWIEGIPLTDYILSDPSRLRFAAQLLGALQREIHSQPAAQLPSQRERLIWGIEDSRLGPELKAELLQHLERLSGGTALCHGDFHPENVLIGEDRVYAIDWPNAVCGNPLADVARTVLLIRYSVLPQDLPARDKIMRRRKQFCDAYLEHFFAGSWLNTGNTLEEFKRQVDEWLPVVAAARLREVVPGEEHRLMKLIHGIAKKRNEAG